MSVNQVLNAPTY